MLLLNRNLFKKHLLNWFWWILPLFKFTGQGSQLTMLNHLTNESPQLSNLKMLGAADHRDNFPSCLNLSDIMRSWSPKSNFQIFSCNEANNSKSISSFTFFQSSKMGKTILTNMVAYLIWAINFKSEFRPDPRGCLEA